MILESAKICNFKSIATENNVLYVDEKITALIGKNESGKSNVLEALGKMKTLWKPLNDGYLKMLTRGQEEQPKVSLRLHFSSREKDTYLLDEQTELRYESNKIEIAGGLSSIILFKFENNITNQSYIIILINTI